MAMALSWLEGVAQLLIFGLQLMNINSHMIQGEGKSFKPTVLTVVVSCVLALIPGFLVIPSTVTQMCATVAPKMEPRSLVWNLLWTALSLGVSLTLYATDRCLGQRRKNSIADESDDLPHGPSEKAPERNEWKAKVPFGIVRGLFLFQTLRLLMQVVNTAQVMGGAPVKGSFAQMLVIEQALTLLEPLAFLGLLIGDSAFSAELARVFSRLWRCGQPPAKEAVMMYRPALTFGFAETEHSEARLDVSESSSSVEGSWEADAA